MSGTEKEIDPIQYVKILFRRKKLIASVVAVCCFISIVVSLLLPKVYRANAVIMPIGSQRKGGLASMMGGESALGLGELLGGVVGGQSSNSQLMTLLRSRTLAEMVVDKLQLMPIFFNDQWDAEKKAWKVDKPPRIDVAARMLLGHVTFMEDKKLYTINIFADELDPVKAAELANTYVEQLQRFISENELTMAKKNRIFVEKQLELSRAKFLEAGKELNNIYGNQVSSVASKVDVAIDVGDNPGSHAPDNLDASSSPLKVEIAELQKQADLIEAKIERARIVKDVPQQVYWQYMAFQKELQLKINSLLSQQYEMAKIEEARDQLSFQVVDVAKPPLQRFKPRRARMLMMTFFVSTLVGALLAFGLEYWEKELKGRFKF